MNFLKAFLLPIAFSLGLSSASLAADVTVSGEVITISGQIDAGDPLKFYTLLRDNPDVRVVLLRDSPGGNAGAGFMIGTGIRDLNLHTDVRGLCASACAFIWMAGSVRYYDPFAEIGVHMPYSVKDSSPVEKQLTRMQIVDQVSWYLGYVGVNQRGMKAITDIGLATGSNDLVFVTPSQLKEWGLDATMRRRN